MNFREQNDHVVRGLWLLLAQVVTIGVGLLLAYRAVSPAPAPMAGGAAIVRQAVMPDAGSNTAPALGRGFRAVAKRASVSVVNIYTRKAPQRGSPSFDNPNRRRFFGDPEENTEGQSSLGSGVIVASQGYILTNNHVVDGADEIAVLLTDGRPLKAKLVGTDPDTDLAVLKVEADKLQAVTFGSGEGVQTGDIVIAIGNPFGVGQTVTMGIVSATGRSRLGINTYEDFIQTDAAINPGNSGGALVDVDGNLVGINSAIFTQSGGSEGIGFAIPSHIAKKVMEDIIQKGRVTRGWIGVDIREITPELAAELRLKSPGGALVGGVIRGGPAEAGGLQRGDVITLANGKATSDATVLMREVAALAPGEAAEFTVMRNGQEQKLSIKVAIRPPTPPRGRTPR